MQKLTTDIVIVGAGIAGLWLLNTLTKQGYDVILIEANEIGGGQSTRSQGIIHGGIKYALNGVLSQASDAIKEMPKRWQQCLDGAGDVDLRGVKQLSDAHYLWSQRSLGAKITSFFAKKAMAGRVDSVKPQDYPEIFQHSDFKGNLYKLNEVVLDIPSVMTKLSDNLAQRILKIDTQQCQWQQDNQGNISELIDPLNKLSLSAQRFIFSAGEGNQAILDALNITSITMQTRPLHMAIVTHQTNLPIYAHCIGASSKPLVTITHHLNQNGDYTWYYGGDIAETGVHLSEQQLIEKAQALTASSLPWVTLTNPRWQTLRINRAEPKQSTLSRPDAAYLQCANNHMICWPTKLALAPDLSDKVIAQLKQQAITPQYTASDQTLAQCHKPAVAIAAWD